MDLLRMIIDMNRDDPLVASKLTILEDYERSINQHGWGREMKYQQHEVKAVDGYSGSVLIGRSYHPAALLRFPRKITNTLYKETHVELDIKASYPTMIYNAFGHMDIPAFRLLATNPESVYGRLSRSVNLSRSVLKRNVMALISSFPNYASTESRALEEHDFIRQLKSDLVSVSQAMEETYPTFCKVMYNKASEEGKRGHYIGMALCYLAMDMENAVMRAVIEHLEEDDMLWLFDGVIMPRKCIGEEDPIGFCDDLRSTIKDKVGIECNFGIKELANDCFAISLSEEEQRDRSGYRRWKLEFERKFFILEEPPRYGYKMGDRIVLGSKDAFDHWTMAEPPTMIKQWKTDANRKIYRKMDFAPPPLVCEPGCLNTFDGFAADLLEPIDDELEVLARIEKFRYHVNMLMNWNERDAEYFLKWLAFKIQQPGLGAGTMPVLRSCQGVGKDQLMRFFAYILGEKYCLVVTNISDVMDKSTGLMENKLVVCFSEISFDDSRRHEENLKRLITDSKIVVERKYVPQYENRLCASFMGFTNNFNAIKFGSDDRRFFPVTCSGKYRNDPAYHGPFNDYLLDKKNQRAVYEWLTSMDLEGFHPMTDRPITETHDEMAEDSKPAVDLFVQRHFEDWIEMAGITEGYRMIKEGEFEILEIRSSYFFEILGDFLSTDFKMANMDSKGKVQKFGSRQLREMSSRIDKYKKRSVAAITDSRNDKYRSWRFEVEAVREYIKQDLGGAIEGDSMEEPSKKFEVFHGRGNFILVKKGQDVVLETVDMEEVNQFIGAAYIKTREDGSQVLVHQQRNNKEYELGTDYLGDYGKARIEMKYPWYRRSPIN
jgi:hypothetical protein